MRYRGVFRFTSLVVACLMLLGSSQAALTAANQTTRVSVVSDGEQGNNHSEYPSTSADGRFVAFQSCANNLVADDTNNAYDIFVHDRQTGETARVSVDSAGVEGNGYSYRPAISADGRYVAFQSYATNLAELGDTNKAFDVFVHDRQTEKTTRISDAVFGEIEDGGSYRPAISGDGRYVAFYSSATNLVMGDTNEQQDVFVHDRQTGETTRVSVNSSDVEGDADSLYPSISADGRFVAFESLATNLAAGGDTNNAYDIFVHDRQTGETTRVSVDSNGVEGDGESRAPAISAEGGFVAFHSEATSLVVGDTNNTRDVFVHDRQTEETTRISVDSSGVEVNGGSYGPAISGDGRFVAFWSFATDLVEGDTNNDKDIFVHNRLTGETLRASVASDGTQGEGSSENPAISADGRYVAFQSKAINLVPGDTNNKEDIFVRGLPYPEVSIEQAAGQPDPTNVSLVHFTATFTKPIDPADFDGSNVLLGGTAGATTAVVTQIAPNDGTTFNIAVSGMTGYGTVTASLPYGFLEDLEGYTNAASASTDNTVAYLDLVFNYLPLMTR